MTLTYPDVFPTDPQKWHCHLDSLSHALKREFGSFAAIWRIEFEVRKTGTWQAECAPHFHLAVYPLKYTTHQTVKRNMKRIREWISETWYRIVESDDPEHLNAGTSVRLLRKRHDTKSWLTYMTKPDAFGIAEYYPNGTGRVWGIWHGKSIPLSPVVKIPLSKKQYMALFRYFQTQLGDSAEKVTYPYALHCFLNRLSLEDLLDLLDDIEEESND